MASQRFYTQELLSSWKVAATYATFFVQNMIY